MGYRIVGISVNADAGATLPLAAIVERMRRVRADGVIIADMNKPRSDTAAGLRPGLLELARRGLVFVRLDEADVVPTR